MAEENQDSLDEIINGVNTNEDIVLDSIGKQVKTDQRIKTGDDLIPKTSFKPIADPENIFGLHTDDVHFLEDNMRYVYEDLLKIFVASKTPITLWGPPGSGKTRSIEALGELTDENGVPYQVITIQPSTEDATVMHGLMTVTKNPSTGEKIMERSIPQTAESIWRYFNDKDGLTIMFLDEMTTCIPAQQNAMLGLLTHGKYGNLDIHPYTTFVMAANPPGTVQTVQPISEAVINRGGHIPWYSSYKHWYDKWETGFNNPSNVPQPNTQEFMWDLIQSDPEYVFRFDPESKEPGEEGWTTDNLIPKEQMESSERVFTEVSRVHETINKTFKDAPYEIYELYLKEALRAVAGDRWARNAVKVERIRKSKMNTKESIEAVNKYKISPSMDIEEVVGYVGDSLHRKTGKIVSTDKEVELADRFVQDIFDNDDFSITKYLAFWTWLSTMPQEATIHAVMSQAFDILYTAITEHSGEYPRSYYLPSFIPDETSTELKTMLAQAIKK